MTSATLFDLHNAELVPDYEDLFPATPQTRYAPPETRQASLDAKASLTAEILTAQQQAVLAAILAAGARGLTDEEGIVATGLNPSSYRPRRGELQTRGLIQPKPGLVRLTRSGRRAVIWIATGASADAAR